MALLDDLKARVETDLPDPSLQALLDEATGAIEQRCGPAADAAHPLSILMRGGRRTLRVDRRVDLSQPVVAKEHAYKDATGAPWLPFGSDGFPESWDQFADYTYGYPAGIVEDIVQLAADDWRALYRGWTLQRLPTGTHRRVRWAPMVELAYVPVDDTKQRNEVAIKLAILALQYDGATDVQVGDVHITKGLRSASGGGSPLIYVDERERLIASLFSSRGIELR